MFSGNLAGEQPDQRSHSRACVTVRRTCAGRRSVGSDFFRRCVGTYLNFAAHGDNIGTANGPLLWRDIPA
jgi:hypothetical protein